MSGGETQLAELVDSVMAHTPRQASYLEALRKREKGEYASFRDRLANELHITGQKLFGFFALPKLGHRHIVWWSIVSTSACVSVFSFMASEWPLYDQLMNRAEPPEPAEMFGPKRLLDWLLPRAFTHDGRVRYFSTDFLILWNGRYAPAIVGGRQYWRWITSLFVHSSTDHLGSNMAMSIFFSANLEYKYGSWRVALLWLVSGLGGNLFSAIFEDRCLVVVGASGAAFGMAGLFAADMILNYETIQRPLLRILFLCVFLGYFFYQLSTDSSDVSHNSHIGGFVCGLFPAFLYLPNFKSAKWEAILPVLGLTVCLVVYVAFPVYVYTKIFDNLSMCSPYDPESLLPEPA